MRSRTMKLVLEYDGAGFAGWQRQPDTRTVQGVLEDAMERLCGSRVPVTGAGRTDAGVHAAGQAAGVIVHDRWFAPVLLRALNAVLPIDVRVTACDEMVPRFHARYDATARTYRYLVGTDGGASSPFRSRWELVWRKHLERRLLDDAAASILGDHAFRGFAVRGTAPRHDDHRCTVTHSAWRDRDGGLVFRITANRFLHHMVRFLVGTMLDIASGRREPALMQRLLAAAANSEVSPPAPPHGLYLDSVEYPADLYLGTA